MHAAPTGNGERRLTPWWLAQCKWVCSMRRGQGFPQSFSGQLLISVIVLGSWLLERRQVKTYGQTAEPTFLITERTEPHVYKYALSHFPGHLPGSWASSSIPDVISGAPNCPDKENKAPGNRCDPNGFIPLHSVPPFSKYFLSAFMEFWDLFSSYSGKGLEWVYMSSHTFLAALNGISQIARLFFIFICFSWLGRYGEMEMTG